MYPYADITETFMKLHIGGSYPNLLKLFDFDYNRIKLNVHFTWIPTYMYHLLELLIFIIDGDCVLREVGAEVQETFQHRAFTIVKFEYRRLILADCKVAAYDNKMMIDCDCLEDTEI